jgi:hypothetical protein
MHALPRVRDIEMQMFPSSGEVVPLFSEAGLDAIALVAIEEQLASSLSEYATRLRLRALSTFEHMSENEIAASFARLDAASPRKRRPGRLSARDLLVLGRQD